MFLLTYLTPSPGPAHLVLARDYVASHHQLARSVVTCHQVAGHDGGGGGDQGEGVPGSVLGGGEGHCCAGWRRALPARGRELRSQLVSWVLGLILMGRQMAIVWAGLPV